MALNTQQFLEAAVLDSPTQHTSFALSIKGIFGIFSSSKPAENVSVLCMAAVEIDKVLITVIIVITAVLNKD